MKSIEAYSMTSPKFHLLWILEHLVQAEEFHGTSVLQTRSQVDFSSLVKNFGSSYSHIAGKENQIKGRSQDFPLTFFLVSGYIVVLKREEVVQ